MVGLICKVLVDLVRSAGGEAAVTELRRKAGLPEGTEYKLDAVYDDAEWHRLLGAACDTLGVTPAQAEAAYADFCFQDSLARWGRWFQMSRNSREFLLRQSSIHNSLAAGVREEAQRAAIADKFRLVPTEDGLVTHYRSANGHCGLYEALAHRIIEHFGDEAVIEERRCMLTAPTNARFTSAGRSSRQRHDPLSRRRPVSSPAAGGHRCDLGCIVRSGRRGLLLSRDHRLGRRTPAEAHHASQLRHRYGAALHRGGPEAGRGNPPQGDALSRAVREHA